MLIGFYLLFYPDINTKSNRYNYSDTVAVWYLNRCRLIITMEETAISDGSIIGRAYSTSGYFKVGCSLYKALNKTSTTLDDIMRWQWQIAQYINKISRQSYEQIYPIDVNAVHIDGSGNVVSDTIVRREKSRNTSSYLVTATTILSCHSVMFNNIKEQAEDKKKQVRYRLCHIVGRHVLANANLEKCYDVVESALYAVNNLCQMVESGLIDELSEMYSH